MPSGDNSLVGMRMIFLSHCRRKGAQGDFVSKFLIPAHDNIFETTLIKLTSRIASIISMLESAVFTPACQAEIRLADSMIRSLGLILSDRSFSLRGLKKEEDKVAAAIAVLRDAATFSRQLQSYTQSFNRTKLPLQIRLMISNIDIMISKSIPSKILSVERFIETSIGFATRKELLQRFKQYPDEFSAIRQDSIIPCGKIEEESSNNENEIVLLLSKAGYDRLFDGVNRAIGRDKEEIRRYKSLFGKAINITVESLISCIVETKLRIDEDGLYKLYRLFLGVEGQLSKARTFFQHPNGEKFLENRVPWTKVQILLDYLNSLVFKIPVKSGDSRNLDFDRLEYRDIWAQLATSRSASNRICGGFFHSRKKLKGSVFVELKINESLL